MGCEYSVCLDLAVKNGDEFMRLSRSFFDQELPHLRADWEGLKTVDSVAGFLVAQNTQPEDFMVKRYEGGSIYQNCFTASYGWHYILDQWFKNFANSLGDDSALLVSGESYLECYIKNGAVESITANDLENNE